MNEGFDARAVAVFKQIQGLDPERWESYVPLAELYQRMGLNSEAAQALLLQRRTAPAEVELRGAHAALGLRLSLAGALGEPVTPPD